MTTFLLIEYPLESADCIVRSPYLASRPVSFAGLQHRPMNHLRWRHPDRFRSWVQTATQCEGLRLARLACNVSSVDSNRWRAAKSKLACHSFVGDEYLANVRRYAFRGQDILDELYRRRMRRALRYVQDFHSHLVFSGFCAPDSDKSGQRAFRVRRSPLQARRVVRSSCSRL